MKGQVRKTPQEFLDNELVIASLDGYGRLQIAAESGIGDASAAKQDEQTALLESINAHSLDAGQYRVEHYSPKYLYSDLATLANLDPLIPAGFYLSAIHGERTSTGQIHLHGRYAAPGDYLDLNFGPLWDHYGNWDGIGPLTSASCFPLRLLFKVLP